MTRFTFILSIALLIGQPLWGQSVKGFNLTENGEFRYKANPAGEEKTKAQEAVDRVVELGGNHIILNVRAKMIGPFSNSIEPVTGSGPIGIEAREMASLVRYAHDQGLTVGIRPIVFVVGPNGEFPVEEVLEDGTTKVWWHGNIQPSNPNTWFEQFQLYLDRYVTIARLAKVDDFTIGAELYSMTVGIEDQWPEYPHGFPGRWLELLRYVKAKIPNTRIAYDINFTDDTLSTQGLTRSGGELERWRYRLVDLAEPEDPEENEIWQNLIQFWTELDRIGIDMYRSFAFPSDDLPADRDGLLAFLSQRSMAYSAQLDTALLDIEIMTGVAKKVVLKEVGYRSVENAFINPFTYATAQGPLNIEHQAISYQALFNGFWEPGYPWFDGIAFWDISLNPNFHGSEDRGFSPYGKEETEAVLDQYFKE